MLGVGRGGYSDHAWRDHGSAAYPGWARSCRFMCVCARPREFLMPQLWITIALLLGSAIVIYLSCELFVNGVEWVGAKLAVGQKATGDQDGGPPDVLADQVSRGPR